MAWERISDQTEMVPGTKYRMTWVIQSPYPMSLMRSGISSAVNAVDRVHKGMTVHEVNFIPPERTAYVPEQGTLRGRYQPWEFNVIMSKGSAGNSPLAIIIGFVAAILFGLGIVSILNRSAERFVKELPKPIQAVSGLALILIAGFVIFRGKVF